MENYMRWSGMLRNAGKKRKIRIACVGIENQTNADPDMPLRVIGYDRAEYRAQLLTDNETNSRYPVVTLVLYFGHKKRWNLPTRLLERVAVPERFRPFVNDYKVNLFEIAFLSREQVNLFQSDFRIVADYCVQRRLYSRTTGICTCARNVAAIKCNDRRSSV